MSRPSSAPSQKASVQNGEVAGSQVLAVRPSTPPPPGTAARENGDGQPSSNIDIFVRIRPSPKPSPRLNLDPTENKLEFNIPRDLAAGYVNNQREHYDFRFNGLIGPEAKQDEVTTTCHAAGFASACSEAAVLSCYAGL